MRAGANWASHRAQLTLLFAVAASLLWMPATAGATSSPRYLFFADSTNGNIGRSAPDGTDLHRTLITGASSPSGLAVSSDYVYWANLTAGTIGRAHFDGTGVESSFISGLQRPTGLAVDGGHLYWTDQGDWPGVGVGTIGRANLDGTNVNKALVGGLTSPTGIFVSPNTSENAVAPAIYWTGYGGSLWRANLDGSAASSSWSAGTSPNTPVGIAVVGPKVYWSNSALGTIGSARLAGGGLDQINNSFISGTGYPQALAADADRFYWADQNGKIGAALVDGSSFNGSLVTGSGPTVYSGIAITRPEVTVSPVANQAVNATAFGATYSGQSRTTTFSIKNSGSSDLQVASVSIVDGTRAAFHVANDTCSGNTVLPSASCAFDAVYAPATQGVDSSLLIVRDNAPDANQTRRLTGTAVPSAVITNGGPVIFGKQNIGASSSYQTVTLRNDAPQSLAVQTATLQGVDASQFTVGTDTCSGQQLTGAGGTCSVQVRFSPTSTGAKSASLRFEHAAPDSPQSLQLSGQGTAPIAQMTPASWGFADTLVTESSGPKLITLNNLGSGPLAVSAVTLDGADPDQFVLGSDSCSGSALVAGGGSCTVAVRFAPSSAGSKTASLKVIDDAAGSPHSVALSARATTAIAGTSLASWGFADTVIGQPSDWKAVTLSNSGDGPLKVSVVELGGTGASEFQLGTSNCAQVAPGGSCVVQVRFTPTVTGTATASLAISDNAAGSPRIVSLWGKGTAPNVEVPSAVVFNGTYVGQTSVAQVVTFTNSGDGRLEIGSLDVLGDDAGQFVLGTNTCSGEVAPGSSCAVAVNFTPTSSGSKSAFLSLSGNVAGSPKLVSLSGLALAPVTPEPPVGAPESPVGAPPGVTTDPPPLVADIGTQPPASGAPNTSGSGETTPKSACRSRREFISQALRVRRGSRVSKVVIRARGRKPRTIVPSKGKTISVARVGTPSGTFTLHVTVISKSKKKRTVARTYRPCS